MTILVKSGILLHFGGKSGTDFRRARGMDLSHDTVKEWFAGRQIRVIDSP